MPPEGYQPLLPNPPEDNYRGEVENHSDAGSVIAPLLDNQEGTLVTVENPTPRTSVSTIPLEPLFLRLDSLGNVTDEEVPQLPARAFTNTYMGSIEPIFGDEYRTLVCPTTAVDTNPTLVHYVWRTSSRRDLYEHFESFRQPFNPHDPPVESGPSDQTMNHSIDQVINPTVASAQVYPNVGLITYTHSQGTSIPTPAFTNFHSTAPHVPHDLARIYFHPRMQALANQIEPTGGKPLSRGPIPPGRTPSYGGSTPPEGQPPFHVLPGGKPPFASHTLVINPPLVGGQPSFVGNPSQSWGVSLGGTFTQPHVGGHSYHNPQGGISNLVPSGPSYGQRYPSGIPNTTWSPQGKQPYTPHGPNVYPPPGSTPYPPQGHNFYPPHGQANHPAYNAQNPPGYENVSQPLSNLVYPGQQQLHVGVPTGYNYPPNLFYGPTGVPMPHQYHLQINRQLLFLATLDLPDLSRLTNDPIFNSPVWPVIPAKLPSDIPKFDGKSGEDPNNHVMNFYLWCLSNSLMDDSICLRLFQRTLTGSATKWYIELPCASLHDFNSLAMSFLMHFQLPIRYEMGTELLTSLRQTEYVHLSDHIHEWRLRQRMIKVIIPDILLAQWFTKSLLPPIACDVTMGGTITEEETISCAQYLDLVYSQSGTLYGFLPNVARANTDPSKPSSSSHVDGVIDSVKTQSTSQSTTLSSTYPQTQISEVNAIQSALHNNLEVRRRQKINQKILITMNNQKIKLKHLLPKSNHNGN
jgi:hypothetical protein